MLRTATSSDIPGIRMLLQSVPGMWQESWRADVLETALSSAGDLALVHEAHNSINGFACAHDVGFRAYLSELVVTPGAERQGIGSQLLSEIERRLVDRGCLVIIADAWRDAEPFYRSLGWSSPSVVLLRKSLASAAA